MDERLTTVVNNFDLGGEVLDVVPYGDGHINETYAVTCRTVAGIRRYILQRVNHYVFKNVAALMENIVGVTSFLAEKIEKAGGDPRRETLTVVATKKGKSYLHTDLDEYWRAFLFIEDCVSPSGTDPELFRQSGLAFGKFQRMLADYPADTLHESIPNFHHTPKRIENLEKSAAADVKGRAAEVEAEIRFVLDRRAEMGAIVERLADGRLPLRVTHNDTKSNNVLLDGETGKPVAVIDLDTVMPGSSLYDFGDSIRFGASSAAEDETDLDKVYCDLGLFEKFAEGFLAECGDSLTEEEIRLLPLSARIITCEIGMRFLTDYLDGDVYFRIHREKHNLDRARNQFKLVADMEKKAEEMDRIIEKLRSR